jgi:hypothetical protein
MKRKRQPRIGTGRGCWVVSLIWIWAPVFRHCVGGGKRADALRRRSRARPCDLPFCRCGSLRIIAAITQEEVITRILRHLKLASVPPPIAPASEVVLRRPSTPEMPGNAIISDSIGPVYSARSRSTPCCEPQRQAAAGCWGRRWRRLQGAATGGRHRNAQGASPGLRSGGADTKIFFEFPTKSQPPSRQTSPFRGWPLLIRLLREHHG